MLNNLEELAKICNPSIRQLKDKALLTERAQYIASRDIDKIVDRIAIQLRTPNDDYERIACLYTYTTLAYYNDLDLRKIRQNVIPFNYLEIKQFSNQIIHSIRGTRE